MTGTAEAVKHFRDSMLAGMEGCADSIAGVPLQMELDDLGFDGVGHLMGRTAAHKKFDGAMESSKSFLNRQAIVFGCAKQILVNSPKTDQNCKVRLSETVMKLFDHTELPGQCLHQHLDLAPDNIQTVSWDSLVSALKKASLHEN
jgi:hypothetical protein